MGIAALNLVKGLAVSVILYASTAIVLFTLLRKLLKNVPVSVPFICTLLFIAHPVHTEVVANIKSGDELLCFLFFIASAVYFLAFIDTGKKTSLIFSVAFFFLSLLSKESGLTFLAVFPLLAYFFRGKGLKESLTKSMAFLIPAIVFLLLHQHVISHAGSPPIEYTYHDNSLVAAPNAMSRLATAIYINGDYLLLLLFPLKFSSDYSFNQIQPVTFMNVQVILTIAFAVWMVYFIFKKFKSRNEFVFVMLFYLITISLVSNIILLIGATKADRFLYTPSIAFTLFLGMAGHRYLKRNHWYAVVFVLFAFYSMKTIARNADWKNNLTLFQQDVKTAARSANTHYNYGIMYMDSVAMKAKDPELKKQLLQTSLNEFSEAVRIDSLSEDAYKELGRCYFHLEDYSRSIENLLRSLKLNPNDLSIYGDLGNAYFRNENFNEAIEALNKSVAAGFATGDSYNFLGSAYFKIGDYPSAIIQFNKSLEKHPDDDAVLINLGSAYGSVNDFEKAISAFNKSLQVNPFNERAYQYLGLIYEEMGNKEKATENFSKANQLTTDPR